MSSVHISLATNGVEEAVRARYADASRRHEPCLCAPSGGYDPQFLKVLPQEIIEKDYGCGDPSVHVHRGETILDLGSGSGKVCYICAQKVGPEGTVIGVDFNQPMLDLARKYQCQVAERIGHSNTSFRKGRIQDLRLDLDLLDEWLAEHPIRSADDYLKLQSHADRLRSTAPLVPNSSIDVIISNCVLNLVRSEDKRQLFDEMFRVLKVGGRAVISDIVSDEDVPASMANNAELWSGCISGALREDQFLKAFEDAGFHGISILTRAEQPWQTINGIEFRAVTVQAFKGKQGPCFERNQAVIYRGPWKRVVDDDGHVLERGERMAVCDKTFGVYQREPYRDQLFFVNPLAEVPIDQAAPFACRSRAKRHPRQTKGQQYDRTTQPSRCCGTDDCG